MACLEQLLSLLTQFELRFKGAVPVGISLALVSRSGVQGKLHASRPFQSARRVENDLRETAELGVVITVLEPAMFLVPCMTEQSLPPGALHEPACHDQLLHVGVARIHW